MKRWKDEVPALGPVVRWMLAKNRWSIADLSVNTNLSHGYLCRVLRGEQSPSFAAAILIADALQCCLDHLRGIGERGECTRCPWAFMEDAPF